MLIVVSASESPGAAASPFGVVVVVTFAKEQTSLVVTGSFPSSYIVLYNTSWLTEVAVSAQTSSGFTLTFANPASPGRTLRYKVVEP